MSSSATRPLALLVALSFAPQVVSPAFAADEGSLKWIVGWLVGEAAGNEELVRALDVAEGSRDEGDAAFLAAVLDSYSSNAASAQSNDLLLSVAGRLVRFCAPQVAPPTAVVVSVASLGKQAPVAMFIDSHRAVASSLRGFELPLRRHDDSRPSRFSSDYSQRSQGP